MSRSSATKETMRDVWAHIELTNKEMGCVKEDMATLKADVQWVKTFIMGNFGLTLIIAVVTALKMVAGG